MTLSFPLLLDGEPTGNLDSVTGKDILALLTNFHKESTAPCF